MPLKLEYVTVQPISAHVFSSKKSFAEEADAAGARTTSAAIVAITAMSLRIDMDRLQSCHRREVS